MTDGRLDLGRIHVHSTDQDEVDAAVDEIHEPVVVEVAEVAHREPSIGELCGPRLRIVAVVLRGAVRTPEVEHADLTRRQIVAFVAHHRHLQVGVRPADRSRARHPLLARAHHRTRALGTAVELDDDRPPRDR